jgi:hypothetical protein
MFVQFCVDCAVGDVTQLFGGQLNVTGGRDGLKITKKLRDIIIEWHNENGLNNKLVYSTFAQDRAYSAN